jgi:phenylalanyl-tRNA synthetase beta chain
MKISLNWLRDYVDIPANINADEFGHLFTIRTAEVEKVENQAAEYANMVVGQIQEIHPHPNADKLRVTKTSIGKETLQIICGASNIYEGQYVPVALPGARVRWHGEGDLVTLEPAKLRGVDSFGMICAGDEIGMEDKSDGIMDLSALKPRVGMPLAELLEKNDIILTVENKSLTHRPDLWGHYGIAREIAAITGKPLKPFESKVMYPASEKKLSVRVKDKKLCPRYIGVLIEGIKIEPSPQWMQKRLLAVGYRPINNTVDITNYVMAEVGQPMHSFDADKIAKGIVIRTAKENEEITTLDGTARKLNSSMLVISDAKKAVAIAGVMGAANSEVENATTRIILESANFSPSSVRRTATALTLRTEAVQRFEKSLDPNLSNIAMDRAVELILQICPTARIVGPKIDVKNFKDPKTVITLDLKRVSAKIGKEITEAKAIEILSSLQFIAAKSGKGKIKVKVPSFRPAKDISMEDDLVEEIARLYGYENIEGELPHLPVKLPIENIERKLKHQARQFLAYGLGFTEIYNYSFYNINEIKKCLLPEELHEEIENYLSEDQTHMRLSLVPNMLKNVITNLKNFQEFKIFEIGRTYQDLQEYFPIEEKKICGMIVRQKTNNGNTFLDAKGALEKLLEMLRAPKLTLEKGGSLCTYAHPAKYASYTLTGTGEEIARVFEIHPQVLKNYDLEKINICAFEINFTRLVANIQAENRYRPLPKFPGIEIDVSVLVNKKTEVGGLICLLGETNPALVKEVKLFDIYEGESIPEGKKALAFKVILRSDDRTLTDVDMKTVQQEIFRTLREAGGEIRGL